MINGFRRSAAAIASVLALGAGGAAWAASASATTAAPASPAAPPACTTASLAVWVSTGQANGAAGTIAYPLEFTNISGHPCTVSGYPGVSALNAKGKQLGAAAGRNSLFKAKVVTIAAGGTAHAVLFYADAEVHTSGCKPAAATLLKVYPPNKTTATDGFFSLDGCSIAKNHRYLSVTTIQPGAKLGL
jgi:hypothetical protein